MLVGLRARRASTITTLVNAVVVDVGAPNANRAQPTIHREWAATMIEFRAGVSLTFISIIAATGSSSQHRAPNEACTFEFQYFYKRGAPIWTSDSASM